MSTKPYCAKHRRPYIAMDRSYICPECEETTTPPNTITIKPLPSLAMLNHCCICDGPAEFGVYRIEEGNEILTAVLCRGHTVIPK